jgi:hypothetical protein
MKPVKIKTFLILSRISFLVVLSILNVCWGIISSFGCDSGKLSSFILLPQERIFLQTDRDIYIAGENLFYSMRLICHNENVNSSASKIAYILIRNTNNKTVITAISKMVIGISSGSIFLPDTLRTGLYQISAYTNVMRNMGEPYYFRKTIYIANRFDKLLNDFNSKFDSEKNRSNKDSSIINTNENGDSTETNSDLKLSGNPYHALSQIDITTNKHEYNHRERISADLRVNSPEDDSLLHLSFSVAECESLGSLFNTDSLTAIVQGKLRSRTYTTDTLIQSTAGFISQDKKNDSMKFLPEYNGYILKGRVIDINKKVPAANKYVLISTPDTILNLDYAITDASGQFYFYINDYYEGKKLILSIKGNPGKPADYKIEVEDKFDLDSPFRPKRTMMNPKLKNYILKSQEKVWIQKVYETNHNITEQTFIKPLIIPVLYSSPQYVIYPDDYTEFPDLVEMSKNIIPGVRLRKENNQYTINLIGMGNDYQKNSNPVVFLDGVLVEDISKIVYLGSDKINKIELMKSAWMYGDLEFHGILSIFSKKYEIEHINLPATAQVVNISNFAKNDRLHFPEYDENSESAGDAPDFRQLLYWDPDICLPRSGNKKIEFYSSDISGKYIIKVSGITSKGKILESECEIMIGPN